MRVCRGGGGACVFRTSVVEITLSGITDAGSMTHSIFGVTAVGNHLCSCLQVKSRGGNGCTLRTAAIRATQVLTKSTAKKYGLN